MQKGYSWQRQQPSGGHPQVVEPWMPRWGRQGARQAPEEERNKGTAGDSSHHPLCHAFSTCSQKHPIRPELGPSRPAQNTPWLPAGAAADQALCNLSSVHLCSLPSLPRATAATLAFTLMYLIQTKTLAPCLETLALISPTC